MPNNDDSVGEKADGQGSGPKDSDIQAGNVVHPEDALPGVKMSELSEGIQAAAARAGWAELREVQALTIPYVLAKRDLMIQSRTGSGKTGAFLLPILERIDADKAMCQVLILVPTRELCQQVAREAVMLAGDVGVRTVAVYGGVGYGAQMEAFRLGAHVVVGTPGRVLDHLLKRSLKLDDLQMMVFDEADRMLSMGFFQDMVRVKQYLPRHRVNGYMFSATFPPHVVRLAGQFLRKPEVLSLSRDHVHVTETEHIQYFVPDGDKDRALVRIIEIENPTAAIIFCNTKSRVHFVTVVLQRFGYDADELSADLDQKARDRVLTRVREGKLRFLVATDVAARGIDIPELSHIFQHDVPEDAEIYIHRAGRTGRVDGSGEAVTLVAGREVIELRQIARRYGIEMQERELPSDEDVQAIVAQRVTAMLEGRLRDMDNVQRERMTRFVPLARTLGESDDELAVIAMLLDEYYQKTLHAGPELPEEPAREQPRAKQGGRNGGRDRDRDRGGSRGGGGGGRRPRRH